MNGDTQAKHGAASAAPKKKPSGIKVRTDANGIVIDADRGTARMGRKWVRWNAAMKRDFLDHLAATCNVTEAARTIGVCPASIYTLRRRDERFAAEWERALALGYQMLETQLVGHVLARDESNDLTNGLPAKTGAIFVENALRLLTVHRAAMQGTAKAPRGGRPYRVVSQEETDAALMKSIAKTERKLGIQRGEVKA